MSLKQIEALESLLTTCVSLESLYVNDEDGESYLEETALLADPSPSPEQLALTEERNKELHDTMSRILTPRDVEILLMYFGFKDESFTLQEIGNHFGISRERVRQVLVKSIRKLRIAYNATDADDTTSPVKNELSRKALDKLYKLIVRWDSPHDESKPDDEAMRLYGIMQRYLRHDDFRFMAFVCGFDGKTHTRSETCRELHLTSREYDLQYARIAKLLRRRLVQPQTYKGGEKNA